MRKALILGLALAGTLMFLSQPAAAFLRWSPLTQSGCLYTTEANCANGSRKYSGILLDIPWGKSWELYCKSTPHAKFGRVPDVCETTTNAWGNWYQRDPGCQCQGTLPGGGTLGFRKEDKAICDDVGGTYDEAKKECELTEMEVEALRKKQMEADN